jgi:putative spermidine/putrescine transport system substrate-binding protein
MTGPLLTRRHFGALAGGFAAAGLLGRAAFAANPGVVAATFPGAWEDAYRRVLTPMVEAAGFDLTIAPSMAQDQLAKVMASRSRPAYDSLLMSPGQTAVATENDLIQTIDPSKIPNWSQLDPSFQTPWGPTVTVEVNGIAYNPDLVPRPKGYKDLFTNPAYAGKVSWTGFESNTAVMAYTEIAKIFGTGPDDMDAVFKLFKDNPQALAAVVDSTNHQMSMYQQGDIAVFMCSTNNVAHLKSLGLTAEFVHPETGSPAAPVTLHLTKGAADPDGVYAYMNAAISKPAQEALQQPPTEMFPTNTGVDLTPSIEAYITKAQVKTLVYPDWISINKNRGAWTKAFDAIVAK